jgi:hypothetical protein
VKTKDPTLDIMRRHRQRMSAVCADIKTFCEITRTQKIPLAPPQTEIERLLAATLHGFAARHISLFGSIVILEKSGRIDEAFILARTLFDVYVDTVLLWNRMITQESPEMVLQRIMYEWDTNKFQFLKDNPNLTDEMLATLQSNVKKVPGLSAKEHNDIVQKQHFTGMNMRDRCKEIKEEEFYKPMFCMLSRYTHGMTFELEIAMARGKSFDALKNQWLAEENLVLTISAMMTLLAIEKLAPFIGFNYDKQRWTELFERIEALADEIPSR